MPEFEAAIRALPVERFLELVRQHNGLRASDLMQQLEGEGYERAVVVRLLQSQLDAGTITLGGDMTLSAAMQNAA